MKRSVTPSPTSLASLVDALASTDPVRREAAIARLRVHGHTAIPRLRALLASPASAATRAAAVQALEGIDDPAAAAAALPLLQSPEADIARAAIGVLRVWVAREHGVSLLDALSTLALDVTRDPGVRLAALDALSELPRDLVAPIVQRLGPRAALGDRDADDPLTTREWLAEHAASAPLSVLHRLVVRSRDHERTEPSASRRREWLITRAAVHAALARRGSRVALYDLREAFDAATEALPLDFVTAASTIGDHSCLEPLARAWAAAPRDVWWRDRLVGAAHDIAQRARLTVRHAVMKRVRSRWPGFL